MQLIFEHIIPPTLGFALIVEKGQTLRVIDIEGKQVVDMALFNAVNPREKLSTSYSRTRYIPKLGASSTRSQTTPSRFGCGSALFLDRDGTINRDRGYVHRIQDFEFVPGIFDLARFWTRELARPIVVITNQSGIGRGYFDESAFAELTCWMCRRFAEEQTQITRVYHCPYHSTDAIGEYRRDDPWRKPKPGMILQAASDLGLDLSRCAIIGDKMSDIEAGAAAGIPVRILFAAHEPRSTRDFPSFERAADHCEAVALLRRHFATAAPL
jgi:D-glycero-D-manno-heptose 1,7-bisphosphate phosphatase